MKKRTLKFTTCLFIFLFKDINNVHTRVKKRHCDFSALGSKRARKNKTPCQYIHLVSHSTEQKGGCRRRSRNRSIFRNTSRGRCRRRVLEYVKKTTSLETRIFSNESSNENIELQDSFPPYEYQDENQNKLIGRTFEGITIYPLEEPENYGNKFRTKLPSKEFKPKRSLGQNYLKDENIIQKMVKAIEINASDLCLNQNIKSNTQSKELQKTKNNKLPKKNRVENRVKIRHKNRGKKDYIKNKEMITIHPNGNGSDNVDKQIITTEGNHTEVSTTNQISDTSPEWKVTEMEKGTTFESIKDNGKGIIELGCGLGQISKFLFAKYKKMTAVEIDSRALSILSRTMPGFDFIHDDVLQINYKELSESKGTKLTIIGNLPFYITSQILFCLLDFHEYIEQAIVTIQYEVGQRIIAKPNEKCYSILSILFNLYTTPHLLFKIPSNAFYPVPKVEAAVMKIIFKRINLNCNLLFLKEILRHAFQQRRKKLKSSLKPLLAKYTITQELPPNFCHFRPQQLTPYQFIDLTNFLFPLSSYPFDPSVHTKVWRKKKHGD
ncbi:dimethyladenosine transferase [Plasmodium gonderi]|uniref:rRNA adenine N(6)-methyltransferase n=1 Tax=Plasmodium gonderi TaxID=77519 RepID=A0A1Y1JTY3_PLAGO|nr:dimethyladenosine transferase [Plasmodium gonderi]GAW83863.1 dimethyladenosine transferase [Plasmodium gonderi]